MRTYSTLLERLKSPGPKRILALDGGGIRGILTLGYLERLENILQKRHQNPDLRLCDYFDLVGGTSTGAIIAASIAIGKSVAEIKEGYHELGQVIFGKRTNMMTYIRKGQKYDSARLSKILRGFFGKIKLGDGELLKTGLCIIAKRAETFSTWPLINHPEGKFFDFNKDIPLWQVVRASVAAPTYFLPIVLDIGEGEKGAFIDGGISTSNNPALRMFLVGTLKGYPFHWSMGPENLLLVSVGTGRLQFRHDYKDFQQSNILSWASKLPDYFMKDANFFNQLFLQMLSDSPTSIQIDSEIGDLKDDHLGHFRALSYLRYNFVFSQENLSQLGYNFKPKAVKRLSAMDRAENLEILDQIGQKAAVESIHDDHFMDIFDLNDNPPEILRYETGKDVDLPFEKVVKKDIPIHACQIHQPFEVMTLEGLMKGKAGDFLMKGIRDEYYVCDQEIFYETYKKL